jgi:hypothetical protein
MSRLLEKLYRVLGAVEHGTARVGLRSRRHDAIAKYRAVTVVVIAEQAGG